MYTAAFALGPLETNCFIVHNGREALIIDPGGNPAQVISYLREHRLSLTHILCTHLHFDHTLGVQELVESFGVPVYASEADRYLLQNELGRGGIWGFPQVPAYEFQGLEPGEQCFSGMQCKVLLTPGHTPGGLSFYFSSLGAVFAGDTLFYRSVGRTDFPGGDQGTLLRSIREQLFSLAEETQVYSGHGPATGIGDEKRNNPFAGEFARL